jgi:hypothetical protein
VQNVAAPLVTPAMPSLGLAYERQLANKSLVSGIDVNPEGDVALLVRHGGRLDLGGGPFAFVGIAR